jgi:hypothetical protein
MSGKWVREWASLATCGDRGGQEGPTGADHGASYGTVRAENTTIGPVASMSDNA